MPLLLPPLPLLAPLPTELGLPPRAPEEPAAEESFRYEGYPPPAAGPPGGVSLEAAAAEGDPAPAPLLMATREEA